ncbi:hypothetical protein [Chitinasiproducens palmae]|nr:hypothetical protein [Chitinasiproducens palmae]
MSAYISALLGSPLATRRPSEALLARMLRRKQFSTTDENQRKGIEHG